MALALENFSAGYCAFPTSMSSSVAGAINTSGADRLVVIVIGTGRSRPSGGSANTGNPATAISASGLTFTRVELDEFKYNPFSISGGSIGDSSFPNANMAWSIFTAPAASAQTSKAWTCTIAEDGFFNNAVAYVFAISGLPDINDPDMITPVIEQNLTATATRPAVSGVTTSGEAIVFALLSAANSGFTFSNMSGYTKNSDSSNGNATSNPKWAIYYAREASAISGKTIGEPASSGTVGIWHGLAFAIGATDVSGDANASGDLRTVNASLVSGTAVVGTNGSASGGTLTRNVSLLAGHATEAEAIDGGEVLEITFNTVPSGQYTEADYYSIYSIGSRWQNGLIDLQTVGLGVSAGAVPGGAFDNSYGAAGGSGWNPTGSGVLNMEFQTGTLLAGVRFIGASTLSERTNSWMLKGGMAPNAIYDESYAVEFDYFKPSQNQGLVTGNHYSELLMTPRIGIEWPVYQFAVFPAAQTLSGERFAEEIEFKVFHSILDGGDRRSTNGRAAKQVTITLGPGWSYDATSGRTHPNDAWLDGSVFRGNANGSVTNAEVIIGKAALAAQDVVGSYIQFDYPRPVIQQHVVLQVSNSEVYSGGNPTRYGKWHWEYSKNGGVSWVSIGSTWWFHEDTGSYMLAPHTGTTFELAGDVDLGTGAKQWRMVLDAGPAFGSSYVTTEIMFNVIDSEELATQLTIAFTDDVDGSLVTATIGPPGSPYVVAFSDGNTDGLTLDLQNIPNPLLTVDFTDDGQFDTWSDLYPSVTVQTVVVATGKKTS